MSEALLLCVGSAKHDDPYDDEPCGKTSQVKNKSVPFSAQEQLATLLQVKQASISKLERRTDMYISTLRHFIEAMGGELEITATFPDGVVRITQFQDIDPAKTHKHAAQDLE